MKIAIRRIGNSKGVIIPAEFLSRVGLEGVADIRLNNGSLAISPPKKTRSLWLGKGQPKTGCGG
ncbi:MAG: hypothetical protein NBV65_04490 [Burkholderiaceae bacterium]|nr:hypothetical protein [Burkholderiaceae bacterium]